MDLSDPRNGDLSSSEAREEHRQIPKVHIGDKQLTQLLITARNLRIYLRWWTKGDPHLFHCFDSVIHGTFSDFFRSGKSKMFFRIKLYSLWM